MATTIIVVVIVVAVLLLGTWYAIRRQALRRRFGQEYDRLVEQHHSRTAAEKELRGRQREHAGLTIEPLPDDARARYTQAWRDIQNRFVDDPRSAVREADAVFTRLLAEIGYPAGDFDKQASQLSVEHARVLQHYRDAHDVSASAGSATTEQLRQALVGYRAVFADLLGADPVPDRDTSSIPTAPAQPEPTS